MNRIADLEPAVVGQDNLPIENGVIYIANHTSHYDVPVLYEAVPRPLFYVAKKELRKVPFLGWAMWAIGMVFIDRSRSDSAIAHMRSAAQLVKSGRNIISFPEGTRSDSGQIKLFKRGTFVLALEAQVPIVPLCVIGTHNVLPKHSRTIVPGPVQVRIGQPIRPEEFAGMTPESLAAMCQKRVQELYQHAEVAAAPAGNNTVPAVV